MRWSKSWRACTPPTVHVWSTNVKSDNPADHFVHSADLIPAGGAYSLTVQPGYVYSITTTTGQAKGAATSPGQGTLPLPYRGARTSIQDRAGFFSRSRVMRRLAAVRDRYGITAVAGRLEALYGVSRPQP